MRYKTTVSHNCHGDDESCPNCPFLTEKVCLCGKKKLKNQQCWFSDVRCGQICGKKLKCGLHYCRKTCHKSGECEAQDKCRQPCGKPKSICGHPCEHECHAPYPCKQDKPCPHKTFITCECQHKKEEVRCAASTSSDGFAASRSLKCDDECARLERNRKLALAFDIDPATHTDDHIPYTAETLKMFAEDTKWAQEQEREFRVFAGNDKEKRLRFKPMPQHQRAFLRALSEDFGLDSESMDPEPHRHVAVFKTPRFVSAPNKTLRDCLRIRNRQQAALASESLPKASAQKPAAASSAPTEPWNGYLLTSVRFALTTDELLSEMTGSAATAYSSPSSSSPLSFTAHFLPSGDVALQASLTPTTGEPSKSASNTTAALDSTLKTLKSPLTRTCNISNLGTLELCRLGYDSSASFSAADSQETHVPVVLARESDFPGAASGGRAGGGGWSQVAAKAAAPRRNVGAPVVAGSKSGFAVLGSNASTSGSGSGTASASKKSVKREKRKERRESTVADDWEVEEEMIMEREEQDKRAVEGVGYAGLVEGEDEGNKASKTMGAEESTAEPASSVPKTESPAGDDWTVNAEDVVGDDAVVATSESLP
ncbi:MAG: FKBP12-associated protein [Alyxoria varia]|nr:MAG: FKBP12-associated protein [Alyxoria varia]